MVVKQVNWQIFRKKKAVSTFRPLRCLLSRARTRFLVGLGQADLAFDVRFRSSTQFRFIRVRPFSCVFPLLFDGVQRSASKYFKRRKQSLPSDLSVPYCHVLPFQAGSS
ncbi:hypothetical protein BaRGS_00019668 [Batillaria attramentaria]|uniref:Uncharacterized protein n=1 Tax=Batillaria attramentaria TaxID=370345 RepID=A0ABD0KPV5_9CAEN